VRINYAFTGLAVSDRDRAVEWYGRLLGRPPDILPNEAEAVWHVTERASVYVVAGGGRPGGGIALLVVDDLDGCLADIADRGLDPTTVQDLPGVGRKAEFRDADGNTVALAQLLAG
jgi:catechol 2,3-dioxygenase-like lactoylglutathione lyase family enzyme